jgi:hypothetical protein
MRDNGHRPLTTREVGSNLNHLASSIRIEAKLLNGITKVEVPQLVRWQPMEC